MTTMGERQLRRIAELERELGNAELKIGELTEKLFLANAASDDANRRLKGIETEVATLRQERFFEIDLQPLMPSQQEIHELAISKGWWPGSLPFHRVPEALMLICSEAAEAMDDWRDAPSFSARDLSDRKTDTDGKPIGFPTELADIIIRTMDLAEALGIDLAEVVRVKHEFNKSRERLHGRQR